MNLKEKYDVVVNSISNIEDGIIEVNDRFHIQVGNTEVNLVEELSNGNLKFYPRKKRSFETVKALYIYANS